MNDTTSGLMQPTLTGKTVELRPLQREHARSKPGAITKPPAHGPLTLLD
ncbi:hypothetical protein B0G82_3473 [Paraburkholderia sp. BL17N1]|nr:hypothetical protein B0G82_3473 [Paraburkholderia sp. BL17N1]